VKFKVAGALPFLAALWWVGALMVDPGIYSPLSVLLIGLGLIELATIGTVGMVLVGGRWARRVLLLTTMLTFALALLRPVDLITVVGLAISALALVTLFIPGVLGMVRKLPAASGPPEKAVLVTLVGLSAPLVLGVVPEAANYAVVAYTLFVNLSAFLYARTVTGGLTLLRVGVPAAAVLLALPMPLLHATVGAALAALIAAYAWSTDVAVAFHPLIEKGTTYAIPPELAPREILEGARLDEKGHSI
jgi:hypothetical protein